MQSRRPSITDTNFLFLIIALLLLSIGAWVQSRHLFIGLLITQYLIILFPIVLYLKRRGYNLKGFLRIKSLTLKQVVYIVLIVIFSYPIAVFFNYVGILFLSKYGRILPNPIPIPSDINEFLLSFMIVALTPGICEEVMFRGMIMKAYEVYGRKKAIILSAILFGLFHFNLQNLLGPIFLGILFGILVYKTESLLSSIIGHTVNNTIALTIGFLSSDIQQASIENTHDAGTMVYGSIILGVIAFAFFLLVRKLLLSFPARVDETSLNNDGYIQFVPVIKTRINIIEATPIVLVILIFFIYSYILFFA